MPEAASRDTTLLGEDVSYEVRHSDEATEPRIDIGMRGVRVVFPEDSATDPEELLRENAAWVLEKKAKYDEYRERVPDRKFEPGERFPYLGNQYEIVVERRSSSQIVEDEFRLAKHNVDQTSVRRALESLYQRKARERFENRASRFAEDMGVEYNKIEVRNQRTKWGSCSTSGTLGLNWRLMMAPPEIVEYVVIHELAHLREPNHSDSFWELVAKHDPEYQKRERWLKQNSTRLIFSDDDL